MRPPKTSSILGLATVLAFVPLAGFAAGAQTTDTVGQHSAYCGAWQDGAWIGNGRCVEETTTVTTTTTSGTTPAAATDGRVAGRVSGTITSVTGHLVTLQQSAQTLVMNDQPALDRRASGKIAVGRSVVAHGYWKGGTFFATGVDTQ